MPGPGLYHWTAVGSTIDASFRSRRGDSMSSTGTGRAAGTRSHKRYRCADAFTEVIYLREYTEEYG
jgi:hypothetical protein